MTKQLFIKWKSENVNKFKGNNSSIVDTEWKNSSMIFHLLKLTLQQEIQI